MGREILFKGKTPPYGAHVKNEWVYGSLVKRNEGEYIFKDPLYHLVIPELV